ncbi:hypothetical protein [Paenibacillus sp.]|uniref:hypothetical protein n=1 Tax=Paenibacillus sp. TaxID=58172 RepID=UPI0028AF31B0|nr:hypothetical protein [Paenibacillus sp.]
MKQVESEDIQSFMWVADFSENYIAKRKHSTDLTEKMDGQIQDGPYREIDQKQSDKGYRKF